jgi:hypothetical protein
VEESKNVAKILEIRNELPDLKKIVQYSGTPVTHPGTNVVKQLDSIELYKMNVFRMQGITFKPDKTEPDIDRESDASIYTGVHCLDVIFKQGIR